MMNAMVALFILPSSSVYGRCQEAAQDIKKAKNQCFLNERLSSIVFFSTSCALIWTLKWLQPARRAFSWNYKQTNIQIQTLSLIKKKLNTNTNMRSWWKGSGARRNCSFIEINFSHSLLFYLCQQHYLGGARKTRKLSSLKWKNFLPKKLNHHSWKEYQPFLSLNCFNYF